MALKPERGKKKVFYTDSKSRKTNGTAATDVSIHKPKLLKTKTELVSITSEALLHGLLTSVRNTERVATAAAECVNGSLQAEPCLAARLSTCLLLRIHHLHWGGNF